MILSIKRFLRFTLLLVFLTGSKQLLATDEPLMQPLQGSHGQIAKDSFCILRDNNFDSATAAHILDQTYSIQNLVSLSIDPSSTFLIQTDFTASVRVHIWTEDESGHVDSTDTTLTVNYVKAAGTKYNAIQYYSFKNAVEVRVTILNVNLNVDWDATKVLIIKNELTADRDYLFDCHTPPAGGIDTATIFPLVFGDIPDEVLVTWERNITGLTEYDIEWTWVDSSALTLFHTGYYNQEMIFKNNGTRVTVNGNSPHYRVPLLYDNGGILFFRVRNVQVRHNGQRVEGAWTGASGNTPAAMYPFGGHERLLNWQATTSFAEEGKRKSVVQYFDGTLRSRQTVTKDNTTGTTVVAETFYDYQGRASIQVLPAPTLNGIIQYAQNFNKFTNSTGYPKSLFDKLEPEYTVCSQPTGPLSKESGTSQYYSPDNPLIAGAPEERGFNKFIPDAEGYPYTETRYTPDATGRIAAQGGVGSQHQIGSGRETKYFYESVDQRAEIDPLFGTDAGEKSHYFKNIVKDANGQYSISYVDMHGRTIATALAGPSPANLDSLPSVANAEKTVIKDMLDPETNIEQGRCITSSQSLVVMKRGPYEFNYQLSPDQLVLMNCDSTEICYDCLYDLTITITPDCDYTHPFVHTQKNFTLDSSSLQNSFSNVCDSNGKSPLFSFGFTDTLPEGAYTVTKNLCLSSTAQNYYRDSVFIPANDCKTLQDFVNEEYALLSANSMCNLTCEKCRSVIGDSYEEYRDSIVAQLDSLTADEITALEPQIKAGYNEAKANCDKICSNNVDDGLDGVRDLRNIMLRDVSPPNGQYAKLDMPGTEYADAGDGEPVIKYTTKQFNIFNTADAAKVGVTGIIPTITRPAPDWRNALWLTGSSLDTTNPYKDIFGLDDAVNALVKDPSYTQEQFAGNFQTQWAESLLPHHPEYCKLITTESKLKPTYHFEAELMKVNTFTEAVAKGYIDATGNGLINADSFFLVSGTNGYKIEMAVKIKQAYYPVPPPGTGGCTPSMWQIAEAAVFCRNIAPGNPSLGCNEPRLVCMMSNPEYPTSDLSVGSHCADWDYVWEMFRKLYLSQRKVYISKYLDVQCSGKVPLYNEPLFNTVDHAGFDVQLYQFRFPDMANIQTGSAGVDNFMSAAGSGNNSAAQSAGNSLINSDGEATCKAYALLWINRIKECPSVQMNSTDSVWLINSLVAVCKGGYDNTHPYGASSLPSTAAAYHDSRTDSNFRSFPDVLRVYFKKVHSPVIPISDLCHPYMIEAPAPYDKQPALVNQYIITKPTDCECTKLHTLENEYTTLTVDNYGSFSNYLAAEYGTIIAQGSLDTLLKLCGPNPGNCIFIDHTITLPPVLQCNGPDQACISCNEFQEIRALFYTAFGHEGPVENVTSDSIRNINIAFAKFANTKTGFVKNWVDYVNFMKTCSNYQLQNSVSGSYTCDSLSELLTDFHSFYDNINFNQVYQNIKITNCVNKIIDAANALITAQTPGSTILNDKGYARAPYSNAFDVKLKSVTTNGENWFDAANTFNSAIVPLDLDCSLKLPSTLVGNMSQYNLLKQNRVFASDFVLGTAPVNELGNKPVFAVPAENHNEFIQMIFADSGWKNGDPAYDYNAYGAPTPLGKYVLQSSNYSNIEAHLYDFALIEIPGTASTPDDYLSYYNNYFTSNKITRYASTDHSHSTPYVYTKGIEFNSMKRIYDVRFDVGLLSQTTVSTTDVSPRYLICSVEYNDGSTGDAYLFNHNQSYEVAYKEVIDSNLYNPDCEKAFTYYYNLKKSTSYTYHQIDSIYSGTCGIHPSPCVNSSGNCDSLKVVLDSFLANGGFAHTPALDSSGCDTSYIKINTGGWFHSPRFRLADWMEDGVFRMPPDEKLLTDSLYLNGSRTQTFDLNYVDSLCLDNKFTFESRVKSPIIPADSIAYMNNGAYSGSLYSSWFEEFHFDKIHVVYWIARGSYFSDHHRDSMYAYLEVRDSTNSNVILSVRDIPTGFKRIDEWAVMKTDVRDNVVRIYLNGHLLYTGSFTATPFKKFYSYAINAYGYDLQVDWLKMYDGNSNLQYFENFKGCDSLGVQHLPRNCSQDCRQNFVNYFNHELGTHYTYPQIDSVYMNSCFKHPAPCGNTAPRLCGLNEPAGKEIPVVIPSPCDGLDSMALTIAEEKYQLYLDSLKNVFDTSYKKKCLSVGTMETFTAKYKNAEYHYTLYYYDQAGNLVTTIPPEGIDDMHGDDDFLDAVKTARANGRVEPVVPSHRLRTEYRYNTLNQVVAQQTPDAGLSKFWYDRLGRLVVSQNAKQKAEGNYSYTQYDYLGRIMEVGQKPQAANSIDQTLSQDTAALADWLAEGGANKEQITHTTYDIPLAKLCLDEHDVSVLCQKNLRNRVSYTMVFDQESQKLEVEDNGGIKLYTGGPSATYYSYDIHGNVDTLVQDYNNTVMTSTGNQYKKIVYEYDLISGKVNRVNYQPGKADQFYHKYLYDAENRITQVYTSHDNLLWDLDARYSYYKHGPLARTVIGEEQVQGVDYAYTLQGWLKGVNSTAVNSHGSKDGNDMGLDGVTLPSGINPIATDAYGYNLNYFDGEYKSIDAGVNPFPTVDAFPGSATGASLYNGNISSMAVNIPVLGYAYLYGYRYDQLNRLVAMDAFNGLNVDTNRWHAVATPYYRERASYDANGNILTYERNGNPNAGQQAMDKLTYQYPKYEVSADNSFHRRTGRIINNRLRYVKDEYATAMTEDLESQTTKTLTEVQNEKLAEQGTDNYQYDAIGNLIKDSKEGIKISWTVYGKIKTIEKKDNTIINYTYDAAGNRITKAVGVGETVNSTTVYMRDATGNVMSVYTKEAGKYEGNLMQAEAHLYGSSRLGIYELYRDVDTLTAASEEGVINTFARGHKFYELTNHLGNVLVTVSDRKVLALPQESGEDCFATPVPHTLNLSVRGFELLYAATDEIFFLGGFESREGDEFLAYTKPIWPYCLPAPPADRQIPDGAYYRADIITANDYYPFGMMMPGRKFKLSGSDYRYSFNGQEKDKELNENITTALYWEYDSRIGRRWNVDPKPSVDISNYATFNNSPIWFSDANGDTGNPTGGGDPPDRSKEVAKMLKKLDKAIERTEKEIKELKEYIKKDDIEQIKNKAKDKNLKEESDKQNAAYQELQKRIHATLERIKKSEEDCKKALETIEKKYSFENYLSAMNPFEDVEGYLSLQTKGTGEKTLVKNVAKTISGKVVAPWGVQLGVSAKEGAYYDFIDPIKNAYISGKYNNSEVRIMAKSLRGDYESRGLYTIRKAPLVLIEAKVQGELIMGTNKLSIGARGTVETMQVLGTSVEVAAGVRIKLKMPYIVEMAKKLYE